MHIHSASNIPARSMDPIPFIVCSSGFGVMLFSTHISNAVRDALSLCGELLIPSLFPMMIVSALFLQTGTAVQLGRLLSPVTRRLFALPGCAGSVFLTAMVGGYPVGARGIRALLDTGQISPAQARRMTLFCVGAGPGFVVSVVGGGLFGRPALGAVLLSAQILSAVLLGILSRFTEPVASSAPETLKSPVRSPFSTALTDSVREAASAILSLCAFVLAFSALQALLNQFPFFRIPCMSRLLSVLSEVTEGVKVARAIGSPILAAFALGWGGLCVHVQIRAVSGIGSRWFLLFRLLHGLFAAACTFLMLALLPDPDFAVLAVSGIPQLTVRTPTSLFSAALLGLVSVFLLTLPVKLQKA